MATEELEVVTTMESSEEQKEEQQRQRQQRKHVLKAQASVATVARQQAVCVRRAYKHYGASKNPLVVLDGLNMTVPKGSMYVSSVILTSSSPPIISFCLHSFLFALSLLFLCFYTHGSRSYIGCILSPLDYFVLPFLTSPSLSFI